MSRSEPPPTTPLEGQPAAEASPPRRTYGGYEFVFGLGLFLSALLLALGGWEMVENPSHRRLSLDLLDDGDARLARGDALGAAREYRETERILRGSAAPLTRLALALATLGDVSGEVEVRRRLVAGAPRSASAQRELGSALLRAGRHPEAVASFESAIRLDPRSAPAWAGLGESLARQGRHKEAIPAYEHALEIEPGDSAVQNSLGISLAGEGRLPEALTHFRAAAETSKDPAVLGNVRRAEAALLEASR